MATTKRRKGYPPGHRRSDDPYYGDDTLDAHPPYHLLRGKPTPEAMAAARRLAAARGFPPPHLRPDAQTAPAPEARSGEEAAGDGEQLRLAAGEAAAEPPPADR